MKKDLNITITGDICPTDDNKVFFNKSADLMWTDILPVLKESDIVVGNLEFPLTNTCSQTNKTGPTLFGAVSFIDFFQKSNFSLLGLANNHIKDCGQEGVINTIEVCKQNGIKTVGAGVNEVQAKQPVIIQNNGWKIGFMAFAEHEFNAAYPDEAGANLLDIYEDFERINAFKNKVDYLIILYHGGVEYYEYPSPLLQKKCRRMIDSGADFVTCQHSHVVGTKEDYNDGTILYGQGNTIFGYRENNPDWNTGVLLHFLFKANKSSPIINIIPIETQKKSNVRILDKRSAERFFINFDEKNKKLEKKEFIAENWQLFCNQKKALYLPQLYGRNRFFNKLNRILRNKLIKLFYSKKQMQITKNIIRCESHNEVVNTILDYETKM